MSFVTMWNFKHQVPKPLDKTPAPLKDDLPFKSLVERALESQAMGEAYVNAQRMRFMMSQDSKDPLDLVENMDDVLTEFDYCEDMGDAQRAYANYMHKKRIVELQRRMSREYEAKVKADANNTVNKGDVPSS